MTCHVFVTVFIWLSVWLASWQRITLLSFFLETLIADGLFCFLAVRQQRRAHSFLATWRLRSFGTFGIYVATALLVVCPVVMQMTTDMVVVADENMFGIRAFPAVLQCITELRTTGCITAVGTVKEPWPAACAERFPTFYSIDVLGYHQFAGNNYPSEEWCLGM